MFAQLMASQRNGQAQKEGILVNTRITASLKREPIPGGLNAENKRALILLFLSTGLFCHN
jgi:hypothetical protein